MQELIVVNDINKKYLIKEQTLNSKLQSTKIIGYQEFIKKFYFEYDAEAILYIIKTYGVTKEIAEIYLSNLYYIKNIDTDLSKIQLLKKIKRELEEKNLLKKSPMWIAQLSNWKIIFDHISNQDAFFDELVEKCQKITEVEIKKNWNKKERIYEIQECETPKEEVINACCKICHLLEDGVEMRKIYLANLTETHRKNFEVYKKIFSLPIKLYTNESIISSVIASEFQKNISLDLQVNIDCLKEHFSKEEEQKIIKIIIDVCNKYSGIQDETWKKHLILEELKNTKMPLEEFEEAIREMDYRKEFVESDAYVFVLGVNEGNFPKLQKDEKFLSDRERRVLNMSSTAKTNQIAKKEYLEKLNAFSHVFLSYAKKEDKIELYPASLLEEIPCHIQKNTKEDFEISHQYNKLSYASKLDQLRKYGTLDQNLKKLQGTYPNLPYMKYDNTYKPFSFPKDFRTKKRLSYTSLDVFFHCAFRYYLDNVLHLNSYEETFDKNIGTLFHQILKEFYSENFDFELSWIENTKKISITNAKEQFFLQKLKADIKRVIENLKEYEQEVSPQVLTEQEIEMEVEKYPEYTFVGIIDKIYVLNSQKNNLVAIVDYKTGNPNLNLDLITYGINMQLPSYLLLLEKLQIPSIKPIGIYLQKILPTIPERDGIHTEEELKKKKLKFQGFSVDEESSLMKFDPTYENSKWISGMKVSSKGFYPYTKVWSDDNFKKISQIIKTKVEEAIGEMEKGNYQINPKRVGTDLIGCTYCQYKDICYRTEKNIQNIKEQKLNDILGGSANADVDKRTE